MARSSASEERGVRADPAGIDQPLQPVRAGGAGRPIAVALAILAILAALVWQPWGGSAASPGPSRTPPAVAAAASSAAPVVAPETPPSPTPLAGPTPSPRGPRPSFGGPRPSAAPVVDTYLSLGDNDWSVVALLAPARLAAAEQPWIPDATGALQAPGGALLVLQLGPSYSERPLDDPKDPAALCRTPPGFRDYAAAHFPADRVAYLGVTFPGMNPKARVTGVVLGRGALTLKRLSVVTVRLSGMTAGRRYTVPTSGTGGAALFALSPLAILPVAAYRFDIVTPGVAGHHYLYACVDP
ncbi:MAG TPA: hypothetical protein VF323_09535 [Candidatus Limnocylindrales bacterium]